MGLFVNSQPVSRLTASYLSDNEMMQFDCLNFKIQYGVSVSTGYLTTPDKDCRCWKFYVQQENIAGTKKKKGTQAQQATT